MMSTAARVAAAVAAFAIAALVGACSSSPSDQHAGHSGTSTAAQPADHNSDDVAFARNMIPHHQQAIGMAQMVPTNTTNPDVNALAQQIITTQQPEIQAFNVWLMQWGEDQGNAHGGHVATGVNGMVDQGTMDKLQTLNGPDFDKLWLQAMISHHQGAIDMAQQEIAHGQNPDVIYLAKSIITAQQAEIGKMRQLLGG
jgi:uncharacterized protein (DUF305 family)